MQTLAEYFEELFNRLAPLNIAKELLEVNCDKSTRNETRTATMTLNSGKYVGPDGTLADYALHLLTNCNKADEVTPPELSECVT